MTRRVGMLAHWKSNTGAVAASCQNVGSVTIGAPCTQILGFTAFWISMGLGIMIYHNIYILSIAYFGKILSLLTLKF